MNLPRWVDVGCILKSHVVKCCQMLAASVPKGTAVSDSFPPQIAHPVIWKDSSGEQFPKIAIANFHLNGPDSPKPITFELGLLFSHDAVWRLCYDFALLVFS